MKTRLFFLLCVILLAHAYIQAQVKIGDNATTINSNSLLELESTSKGFVLPRLSLTSTSSPSPLAAGLLTGTIVYNTNTAISGGSGAGIYYWDGSNWNFLANTTTTGNYWSITGNNGTTAGTNFLGTTDAKDFVLKTNNTERMRILGAAVGSSQAGWIGMGIATTPKSALDVAGNYTGKNVITIQNTSSTGFSSVDMLDNAGNLAATFGFANTGTGASFSGKAYLNGYGNDFLFTRGSSYDLIMKGNNGYVGLNTSTPSERLHVVGNFYLTGAFMPGGNAGTSGYILTSTGAGTAPVWNNLNSLAWSLTGNSGTNSAINFLGTTDNHPLKFQVNNTLAGFLDSSGGSGNALYGYAAGVAITTGLHNTAMGTQALNTSTSANNNTAFGYQSLYKNTTGAGNTAAGYTSMNSNTTGQYNTAFGLSTLYNNTTGNYNVAVGQSALQNNTTGNNNAVVGEDGMLSNTTGNYLAGIGTNALHDNTSGSSNTAIGESTLYKNTTGNYNTALGAYSLFNNLTASNNISIGYYAGNSTTTGGNNIFIGSQSGNSNTTGSNNTLLGTNTGLQSVGLTNAAAIGYNAKVALNNSLVLGDTTTGGYAVNVGIGVRNPLKRLHIDAAPVGSPSVSDSLKIDHLASSNSAYNKAVMVIDSATGYLSRQSINTLTANNYWGLSGNGGTNYPNNFLGTTDNTSLRFRTNNTEQMILDSTGMLQVGSYGTSSFNTDNPPKLSVDYGTTTSNTLAYLRGSIDSYLQMNIRNRSNGTNASTDYVATSDDGTDSTFYIDMGINSSTYAPSVDNFGGPHDGYLYTYSRNLIIGTQKASSDIIFLSGGGQTRYNSVLRMDGATGNIIIGRGENNTNATGNTIRGPNGNGTNIQGGSLTLQGGSATGTGTGGYLYLNGGTTSTGTAGNIVMSTASSERLRIDQSGNVGIGISNPSYKLSVLSSSNPLYLSGVQATSTFSSDSILTIYNGIVKKTPYSSLPSGGGNSGWSLTGNSGTNTSTNFLGTTDNTGLVLKVNNIQSGYLGNSFSQATTFGYNTSGTSTSQYGTAIGATAQATSQYATALGYSSLGSGQYSTALGYNASSISQGASAIGTNSSASNQYASALGYNASSTGQSSLALGYNSEGSAQDAIAAGNTSSASTAQSIAIGRQATASGYQGISIGYNSSAITGSTTLAIGVSSGASGYQSTAIGYSTIASNSQALALGNNATASGSQSTAIGNNASATGTNTTAIGNGANTAQTNAFVLGNSSVNVGIATTTPNTNAALDVNAKFKLGDVGTVNKNIVSFASSASTVSIPAGAALTNSSGSVDITIAIPSSANYLTSTQATVAVSPSVDLPSNVHIAFARMTSTSQLKIRLLNSSTSSQSYTGSFYITITEF